MLPFNFITVRPTDKLPSVSTKKNHPWDELAEWHGYFLERGFVLDDAQGDADMMASSSIYAKGAALVIGCATGATLAPFLARGLKVIGVDQSEKMIAHCPEWAAHKIVARAENLPFRDDSLDVVIVATGVLDSAKDNEAIRLFLECRRVLRCGGMLLVYCFGGQHLSDFVPLKSWWFYPKIGLFVCKFIQENRVLSKLLDRLSVVHESQYASRILSAPLDFRRYLNKKGQVFHWGMLDLFPTRLRLWRPRDIKRLTFQRGFRYLCVSPGYCGTRKFELCAV